MTHTSPIMSYSSISLFGISEIRLGYKNMSHRKHSESSQFFRSVKYDRGEPAGHFGIQPDFYTSLNLILTFHQQIQNLFSMDHSFSEISAKADQGCIPFIWDFSEGCTSTGHQNVTNSIFKFLHLIFIHSQKSLGCYFFGLIMLKFPNSIFLWKIFIH